MLVHWLDDRYDKSCVVILAERRASSSKSLEEPPALGFPEAEA